MDDNFPETVDNYFKILEENIDILANLAIDLEDEKEDELIPDMELYQLFDMTEDVSESSKIKRAEFNLAQRQVEYSL
jgi:hypothetical protein